MINESNSNNEFLTDFSRYNLVGFHGTSALYSKGIETNGFLPHKIINNSQHETILGIAKKLNIPTSSIWGDSYENWLKLRSVTFVDTAQVAVHHVKSRNAGGQGLSHLQSIASEIMKIGDENDKTLASEILDQIIQARQSKSVVYAVDLSNLGSRLSSDRVGIYHYRWDPNAPLPTTSVISPSRLIAKLEVQ